MSPNDLLYKKGTIQKKVANTNTGLDWPSLTFEAALCGEEFSEVKIITLVSFYEDLCQSKALHQVPYSPIEETWNERIIQRASEIMDEGIISVSERVQVNEDYHGVVIIDEPSIIDDTVTRALQMIEQSKIPGITYFSKSKTFTAEEIHIRRKHNE